MEGLRKRVLLDLFVTPSTMITVVGGTSLILLSEMLGARAAILGFGMFVVGVGIALTNVLFNVGKVTERAMRALRAEQARKRNETLDALDTRLNGKRRGQVPRDVAALRNLRSLYVSFMEDVEKKKIANAFTSSMLAEIDELFNACVAQLERQQDFYETALKVSGDIQASLMKQRETVISEVEAAVTSLSDIIAEARALRLKTGTGQVSSLQATLTQKLEVAKGVEARMAEFEVANSLDRFKEYEAQR